MQNIVITGANSGIGFQAARQLAKENHRVFMLCRPGKKSTDALKTIIAESDNQNVTLIEVDLAERQSIQNAVERIKEEVNSLDVLINNAGIQKKLYTENSQGLEMSMAVNFLAPFILSQSLKELLERSKAGRIVNVVSELYRKGSFASDPEGQRKKYNAGNAYANSKLASVLMSQEMARRYAKDNISILCLHPGVLATDALRDYPKLLIKLMNMMLEKPERGGARITRLATSEDYINASGTYIYKEERRPLAAVALDENIQKQAWELAERLSND